MIKVIVATPKGELFNKEVESIVVSGDTGQIGVLSNRIPLLTKIPLVASITSLGIIIITASKIIPKNIPK